MYALISIIFGICSATITRMKLDTPFAALLHLLAAADG